ncbi:MAG: alpha-L-glutamate ligase-like protein [Planctomycetota bacterium]
MINKRYKLWVWPWQLRRAGILGANSRNLDFISKYNPRCMYPRSDDKAVTKEFCTTRGIPVPETHAIIERFGDLRLLPKIIGVKQSFVVKPARGSGGRGILVIARHQDNIFITTKGKSITLSELRYHVSATLSGLYSLGEHSDRAIIEQQVLPHPVFYNLAIDGTPDIRVIIYRGVPVMAMLRLPTRSSRGRANLHQGAVATGVDLTTGQTFGGVCCNQTTDVHPDTGESLDGITIPYWDNILEMASSMSESLELGYVGIDIALDEKQGPMVMEANVRPGLAIQIANRTGLWTRLQAVDGKPRRTSTIIDREDSDQQPDRPLEALEELLVG